MRSKCVAKGTRNTRHHHMSRPHGEERREAARLEPWAPSSSLRPSGTSLHCEPSRFAASCGTQRKERPHGQQAPAHRSHRRGPEASAKFFEEAFDMKRAALPARHLHVGRHFQRRTAEEGGRRKAGPLTTSACGSTISTQPRRRLDAGGKYLAGRPTSPNSFYEAKYKYPTGLVFDLTHKGWPAR